MNQFTYSELLPLLRLVPPLTITERKPTGAIHWYYSNSIFEEKHFPNLEVKYFESQESNE